MLVTAMNAKDRARAAALTSLAATLTPIARVLMQREMGTATFVLAVKLACLEAAIETLESHRVRLNISRLSVITGMTRKEIALLLKYKADKRPAVAKDQRALRVIRGWLTDPLFKTSNGRPAQLSLRRGTQNFEALVRAHGGDVTPAAVLKELERVRAVKRGKRGNLVLCSTRIDAAVRSLNQIVEFTQLLSNFVKAASDSLRPSHDQAFLGYRDIVVPSDIQAALFRRTFERRASVLLSGVGEWRMRQISRSARKEINNRHTAQRVGVGVYLVSDNAKVTRKLIGQQR